MNHADHVRLLGGGVPTPGGVWADFGSGTGAFTLALAELLGPTGTIYSVDRDAGALREQERALRARFPLTTVHYITADFTRPLAPGLPLLDGALMANALHFQRHKAPVVESIRRYLKPGGRLLVVEYNVDSGNPWVPFPLSYNTWAALARTCGFAHTELLATQPSRFLKEFYSAASW
jgi:ubiquinone/menaquinone biosynthesis C-methylase UbiE